MSCVGCQNKTQSQCDLDASYTLFHVAAATARMNERPL